MSSTMIIDRSVRRTGRIGWPVRHMEEERDNPSSTMSDLLQMILNDMTVSQQQCKY